MLVASYETMMTLNGRCSDRSSNLDRRSGPLPDQVASSAASGGLMSAGRGLWSGGGGSTRDESGFVPLFDGSPRNWAAAGLGHFAVVDGRLESVPGEGAGLFWCTVPTPRDFALRLRWLRWRHEDTSGILVRFPSPHAAAAPTPDALATRGFEVRIDEVGIPGATCIYTTGAILNQPVQRLTPRAARPPMEWNDLEITAVGQRYGVALNGRPVTVFLNPDPTRGRPSAPDAPAFIGLALSPGARVAFRDIRIKAL